MYTVYILYVYSIENFERRKGVLSTTIIHVAGLATDGEC